MPPTEKDVLAAIAELVDPVTGRNYVESRSVKNVRFEGDRLSLDVALGYPAREVAELRPPGHLLPVETARPAYLPPVGNGPPPATH